MVFWFGCPEIPTEAAVLSNSRGGLARLRRAGACAAALRRRPEGPRRGAQVPVGGVAIYPLEVRNVTKRFGGLAAVDGVSIALRPSSVTGLIGANGAGKSTLLGLISGVHGADRGQILFRGKDVTKYTPQRRSRLGLARTFQHPQLVSILNCVENVACGAESALPPLSLLTAMLRRDERAILARVKLALERVRLPRDRWMLRPSQLSAQDRLLTELARALVADPGVLLLDEPNVGFTAEETETLLALLTEFVEQDPRSVLLVTHDITFAMRSAQHIYVMDQGKLICEGSPTQVIRDDRVVSAYLGVKGRALAERAVDAGAKPPPLNGAS